MSNDGKTFRAQIIPATYTDNTTTGHGATSYGWYIIPTIHTHRLFLDDGEVKPVSWIIDYVDVKTENYITSAYLTNNAYIKSSNFGGYFANAISDYNFATVSYVNNKVPSVTTYSTAVTGGGASAWKYGRLVVINFSGNNLNFSSGTTKYLASSALYPNHTVDIKSTTDTNKRFRVDSNGSIYPQSSSSTTISLRGTFAWISNS